MGEEAEEEQGLFGPGSVTWRVHVEPVLWIAGFRALLLQSLHPQVMRGTYQNSALFDRKKAWGRFLRTARFVSVRTFGTTRQVEEAAARVRRVHARLSGFDPDTGKRFPLDEPANLLWVHCCEIDSYAEIARRSGVIGAAEADRYVDEGRRAAGVIGLDPANVPGSRAELDAYFEEVGPGLYATREARQNLLAAFNPPTPLHLLPLRLAGPSLLGLALGSLPRWARRMYRLPALPVTDPAVSLTLRTLRQATLALRSTPLQIRERVTTG